MEYTNEITELRTDSSRTYKLNDGSLQTVFDIGGQTNENDGIMTLAASELQPNPSTVSKSWSDGIFSDGTVHTVGMTETDNGMRANRMYLSFDIPTLPRNPRIKRAELVIKQSTYTGSSSPAIAVYKITGDLTTGTFASFPLDYEMKKNEADAEYTFDITALTDNAYSTGNSSVNLAVGLVDESLTTTENVVLYGASSEICKPEIRITYESSCGINSAYRTQDHSLGKFGEGRVDLACGNLTFESTDFAWAGSRMPVTIRRFYNSALSDVEFMDGFNEKMSLGCGWRFNLMQTMLPGNVYHEGNVYSGYIYTDENGNEMRFIPEKNEEGNEIPGKFISTEDESVKYYHNDDNDNDNALTMGDMTCRFSGGRLCEIKDSYGNKNTVEYTDGRITRVTDGADREFLFSYSGNYLVSVKAPDLSEITYTYTEAGQLNSIVYPDGTRSQVTYSNGKPRQVILLDKNRSKVFRMTYSFSGNRITSHAEHGVENGDYVTGTFTEYSYYAASNRSVVTVSEPADTSEGETEASVISTVYAFDDDGNVISEYAYSPQLENTGVTEGDEESKLNYINYVENMLACYALKNDGAWGDMANSIDDIERKYEETNNAKYGRLALKLKGKSSSAEANGIYRTFTGFAAGEYTFSAYVKINQAFTGSNTPGVYLRVVEENGTVIAESEHLTEKNGTPVRIILPFEITEAKNIKVQILINGIGIAYVSNPQLEKGPFATEYNMMINSSFEDGTSNWHVSDDTVKASTADKFRGNRSLEMTSSIDELHYAYQTIPGNIKASTRETFTLSGWAKSDGALSQRDRDGAESSPVFRLRATIHYGENEPDEYHYADFSPYTDAWQYACVEFAKERRLAVEYIRVSCDYSYNVGTAYFDCIQLKGNSVEYNLDESDFTTTSVNDNDDEIEADDEDTVTEDTAPEFEEFVDSFGNTLTSTTFTDGELGTIYRSSTYDADGNNLIIETDARGNTTTYTVDPETSRNTEVTDRCGNKTAYEYDAAGKTTKVTSKKADGSEIAKFPTATTPLTI